MTNSQAAGGCVGSRQTPIGRLCVFATHAPHFVFSHLHGFVIMHVRVGRDEIVVEVFQAEYELQALHRQPANSRSLAKQLWRITDWHSNAKVVSLVVLLVS